MWRQIPSILILTLAVASLARAEDTPAAADTLEATPADVAGTTSNERIAELVRQLDSPRFAERQAASGELASIGAEAIPALEQAIQNGSREASTRAIELLEGFVRDGSMETQAAATAALTRVAASDDSIAASQASEALGQAGPSQTSPDINAAIAGRRLVPLVPAMPAQVPGGGPPPGFLPQPAVPQIAPGMVPGLRIGGRIQVQRMIAGGGNGVTDITVTENGRTVKIHEDANGIKVEVTEPDAQGNDQTESYEAGSLDELKRQHPEAAKLYQQYNQGIQIRAVPAAAAPQGAVPEGAVPQGAVPVPAAPNDLQLPQGAIDPEALKEQADQLEEAMEFFKRVGGEESLPVQPQEVPPLHPVDPAGPTADDTGADE